MVRKLTAKFWRFQFDSDKAQELSKKLPDSASLVSNIDADVLESSFGPKYGRKPGKELGQPSPGTPKTPKGPYVL